MGDWGGLGRPFLFRKNMSQIYVTIPISALNGAKDLTPQGISEFLRGAIDNQQRAQTAEHRVADLLDVMKNWASDLHSIVNSDGDAFSKFQRLRDFATATAHYANNL
jgi:hypothetical protein